MWPSAYASGALVKCRKVGAANWGNSRKEEVEYEVAESMPSNPDYKGVGAVKDKSQVQKPDSTTVIAPYGQKLGKGEMKKAVEFAKKDVPYQDSKGGHTLELGKKGNVRNLTKIMRGEKQTKIEDHYDWRSTLDEKCWAGYEKKGMKTMFGKRYPNCVKKSKKKK